jgi:hypothetical protein
MIFPGGEPKMLARVECRVCPICGEGTTHSNVPWCWSCENLLGSAERVRLDNGGSFDVSSDANRWDGIATFLGYLSMTDIVLAGACILAGPFTCFMSWFLAYYILLIGMPVHAVAVVVGCKARKAGQFTMTMGIVGTVLALLAISVVMGIPRL